jgi:hypothetical protein
MVFKTVVSTLSSKVTVSTMQIKITVVTIFSKNVVKDVTDRGLKRGLADACVFVMASELTEPLVGLTGQKYRY